MVFEQFKKPKSNAGDGQNGGSASGGGSLFAGKLGVPQVRFDTPPSSPEDTQVLVPAPQAVPPLAPMPIPQASQQPDSGFEEPVYQIGPPSQGSDTDDFHGEAGAGFPTADQRPPGSSYTLPEEEATYTIDPGYSPGIPSQAEAPHTIVTAEQVAEQYSPVNEAFPSQVPASAGMFSGNPTQANGDDFWNMAAPGFDEPAGNTEGNASPAFSQPGFNPASMFGDEGAHESVIDYNTAPLPIAIGQADSPYSQPNSPQEDYDTVAAPNPDALAAILSSMGQSIQPSVDESPVFQQPSLTPAEISPLDPYAAINQLQEAPAVQLSSHLSSPISSPSYTDLPEESALLGMDPFNTPAIPPGLDPMAGSWPPPATEEEHPQETFLFKESFSTPQISTGVPEGSVSFAEPGLAYQQPPIQPLTSDFAAEISTDFTAEQGPGWEESFDRTSIDTAPIEIAPISSSTSSSFEFASEFTSLAENDPTAFQQEQVAFGDFAGSFAQTLPAETLPELPPAVLLEQYTQSEPASFGAPSYQPALDAASIFGQESNLSAEADPYTESPVAFSQDFGTNTQVSFEGGLAEYQAFDEPITDLNTDLVGPGFDEPFSSAFGVTQPESPPAEAVSLINPAFVEPSPSYPPTSAETPLVQFHVETPHETFVSAAPFMDTQAAANVPQYEEIPPTQTVSAPIPIQMEAWQLDDLKVLETTTFAEDKNLFLLEIDDTVALTAQVGSRVYLLKLFPNFPPLFREKSDALSLTTSPIDAPGEAKLFKLFLTWQQNGIETGIWHGVALADKDIVRLQSRR